MSNKEETPVLNFFNNFFNSLFSTLTDCVKAACFLGAILGPIGLICMTILFTSSNKSFINSDSRLEKQIYTILNEYSGGSSSNSDDLTNDQRYQLIGELIKQYDPSTDNLSPVINPNAKPLDIEGILTHFKVNKKGIQMISGPNIDSNFAEEPKEGW